MITTTNLTQPSFPQVSSIKPKIVKSVHYCPQTRSHESRTYIDATDPQLNLPAMDPTTSQELPDKLLSITSSSYPTHDKDGNALETEFGLSVYKDHQTITLQEMPERAPMGQLPRSVELILDHDLVDKVKPGDRVQITGVYRALATASTGQSSASGVFKTVILVNDIKILGRDSHGLVFSPRDVRNIRNLGKRSDILDILGRSICPSIHGHNVIKKALALQLLGGCEKNLQNGTHLRGDINILMVGDPSTAKSQLLRSAMGIAPLAVSTTGKGSSGVGLTAAVTSDPETKERRLEAGAMVLADRGLVCVDEFDKMGENDRVAIHEAMEQQTVTIAKAGMHASLNARCSVLAAANPVYGQYDRKRRIQENIGLPDSLLSRFDLLFVVLDQLDPEADRRIAAHVIRGHMYHSTARISHESDFSEDSSEEEDVADDEKAHTVWQHSRYDVTESPTKGDDPHADDVLQHEFLRKYLHFAKTRMKPVLTEEARECIAGRYAEMRSRQDERTLPVTARSLETIIRLASAHAKVST
jgi:DNA replication licensing factor MCM3